MRPCVVRAWLSHIDSDPIDGIGRKVSRCGL